MLSTGDPLQTQRHIQTESKGSHANGNFKKGSVAILIDEIDFKIKNKTIDTERHYKMIKGSTKKKT